jgi:hypothetical protein
MELGVAILGTLLALAWLIDWLRTRRWPPKAHGPTRKWWNDPPDDLEGDY